MIHLELQPEVEAQLVAEAKSRGLALGRYIEEIVAARDSGIDRLLDEEQLTRDLRQGLSQISQGDTVPARQVFAEFRERHGIRG